MSFRPQASSVPHRRPRSPSLQRQRLVGRQDEVDYGSEAGSRFDAPTVSREAFVPIAYPVAQATAPPTTEAVATARPGAPPYEDVNDVRRESDEESESEMSEFSHSQFMNSDFNASHMGTEYSMHENSALAEEEGGGDGDRYVGTREWARQQRSQNSSQLTAETDRDNPWKGPGRDLGPRERSGGRGRDVKGGRMHDLPPLPQKMEAPSNRSLLSHDLSGFSEIDSVPDNITAPHPAPADRILWNGGMVRGGLTEAAALAADADAQNLARQKQRERDAAEKKRAAEKARAAEKGRAAEAKPGMNGDAKPDRRVGGQPRVQRDGDAKEADSSHTGMSAFAASAVEGQYTHGDPFDERQRNANGTTGEYALNTYHHLIFTPTMFVICAIMLFWEFSLNGWMAEPLDENPSYGPSVDTLITAGAKRTDLIVDDGEWWRLISPMFLHAGVVHFLFNMVGFLQVGAMVERVFGWWRVGIIYLVAGVFGTIVSAMFVPTQVMVGASGAIFGVFGALWADLWQNWSVNEERCRMFTVLTVLTVVNILLGLMPYLDNFAHIGGMIMGFLMGLGVLVQKREDDLGGRLDKKCYQRTLQLVAAVAVPTLLILVLSVLYGRDDPAAWCSWCENISCVEFPPSNPWWACDECSTVGFTAEQFENGDITITCPDETTATSSDCSSESQASLVECCIAICL